MNIWHLPSVISKMLRERQSKITESFPRVLSLPSQISPESYVLQNNVQSVLRHSKTEGKESLSASHNRIQPIAVLQFVFGMFDSYLLLFFFFHRLIIFRSFCYNFLLFLRYFNGLFYDTVRSKTTLFEKEWVLQDWVRA